MSHLKLYRPDESADKVDEEDNFPATISIESIPRKTGRNRIAGSPVANNLIGRAKALYANQSCPRCQHATVEPIELGDAIISPRHHRPIPGTATLVGFHCHSCSYEWPVYYSSPESA